jgi:hypothetical protein
MRGYRKVIIAVVVIAAAAFMPLNEFQARVLEAVTWATLGSNAAIHIGGQIAQAIGKRNTGSNNGGVGSDGASGSGRYKEEGTSDTPRP